MSTPQTDLWQEAFNAFKAHHRGNDDEQATLNRIAAKCLAKRADAAVTNSFDPSNCEIREEHLALDQLNELERYHDRRVPSRDVEPVIVLEYEGRRVLIDGNTRVNKWLSEGGTRLRRAIVIKPASERSAS
jgi:hypothetical protein